VIRRGRGSPKGNGRVARVGEAKFYTKRGMRKIKNYFLPKTRLAVNKRGSKTLL